MSRWIAAARASQHARVLELGLALSLLTIVLLPLASLATGDGELAALRHAAVALVVAVAVAIGTSRAPTVVAVLAWHSLQCAILIVHGLVAPRAAGLLVGVIVLAFVYAGLCLPPWRSLLGLPLAAATVWHLYDLPPGQSAVRLFISATIWVVVAELPSRLLTDLEVKRRQLEQEGVALRDARDDFEGLAHRDPLTGLLNRRAWDNHWSKLLDVEHTSVLALLDLDGFKSYNDVHGHVAGDQALVSFAEAITSRLREKDVIVRWGGDEFVALLPDSDDGAAAALLRRVSDALPAGLTCSIGLTVMTRATMHEAFRRADTALYDAKRQGRDRVVVA